MPNIRTPLLKSDSEPEISDDVIEEKPFQPDDGFDSAYEREYRDEMKDTHGRKNPDIIQDILNYHRKN
jgi:hypothetical protein